MDSLDGFPSETLIQKDIILFWTVKTVGEIFFKLQNLFFLPEWHAKLIFLRIWKKIQFYQYNSKNIVHTAVLWQGREEGVLAAILSGVMAKSKTE